MILAWSLQIVTLILQSTLRMPTRLTLALLLRYQEEAAMVTVSKRTLQKLLRKCWPQITWELPKIQTLKTRSILRVQQCSEAHRATTIPRSKWMRFLST
jgi:hypothetical protein